MGFWAISSFSYYLIGLYVKYFPGNQYINFGVLGLADMFGSLALR